MRGVAVVTGEDFLSPSFPAVALTAGRTWHHVTRLATRIGHGCAIGCRGFAGPIPPPLCMSVMQLCLNRDKRTAVLAQGVRPPWHLGCPRGDDPCSAPQNPGCLSGAAGSCTTLPALTSSVAAKDEDSSRNRNCAVGSRFAGRAVPSPPRAATACAAAGPLRLLGR